MLWGRNAPGGLAWISPRIRVKVKVMINIWLVLRLGFV